MSIHADEGSIVAARARRVPGTAATAKRGEVVHKAAELFDAGGYHNTGVADIAAAAGISKPTLYHYFASKDEILFWIHEEYMDELIARQEKRAKISIAPGPCLLELMADMLEMTETRPGVRVFHEHLRELRADQQQLVRAKRETYQNMVETVISDGIASGELRGLDPRLTTLALFGMVNWAYQWFKPSGLLRSREIAYVFWDILLHGLAEAQLES
jgi:TetR/AcrR family transcriptional regulator, cholesterol catabolism regulator